MVSTMEDLLAPIRNHGEPQLQAEGGEAEAEMLQYLDKLKQIVPRCPKNRRVSRLELIQHVIDYIVDLQQTLEDRSTQQEYVTSSQQNVSPVTSSRSLFKSSFTNRQPLGSLPVSQSENLPATNALRDQLSLRSIFRYPRESTTDSSSSSRL